MRYLPKRRYTWSPNIAYTAGLMASDGCLQRDGRHLDITSVDLEQLHNFNTAIGRALPISRKFNNSQNPAFRIQFSDTAYYDFLKGIGLTPAKSKTIAALDIPDRYYGDFLRGLFDGDGSTYAYMDPRWRSSYMFYTQFASASIAYIHFLQESNSRLIGTTAGSVRLDERSCSLAYAKADSILIYRAMYYTKGVIGLSRKRVKLEGFIKKNEIGIIHRR